MVPTVEVIPLGTKHVRKNSKTKKGLYQMSSKTILEPSLQLMESPSKEELLQEFVNIGNKTHHIPASPPFHERLSNAKAEAERRAAGGTD
jgi:hypothetical protein